MCHLQTMELCFTTNLILYLGMCEIVWGKTSGDGYHGDNKISLMRHSYWLFLSIRKDVVLWLCG